ncbi:MAG: SDR family NAD(P)-dependent oxidoreductase [Candidatus Azotimanducaceae bacterium]|uniref:SDR family NAD(P)-dependent oxidoreductase n=1 Tax=OM182 bacterium TaxID=2510334 RepID=A0A520RZN2_9GAMM|nr:short-chain dehydrogenase [Gammaproteobacteria bacterium]RZO75689.1 MAG: SDR family NAD(P)-dependent oxidoreductase [OM182 bacterium]
MKNLEGKTAFVTGGSTGIGFGIATAFLKAGAKVAITDIRDDFLATAKKELKAIGENVLTFNVDSTDVAAMDNAAKNLEDSFGPIHILCNNAGIPGGAPVLETEDARWRGVFEVNFYGLINGINIFLPRMLDHGEEAHIVNTASFSGIHGHGSQGAYGSSKFAAVGLSEFLRNDLAKTNVGVSVLCPHVADTPIIQNLKNRVSDDVRKMIDNMAVPAQTVGNQVMQAILNKEFYIFCDGTDTRKMLKQRYADLMGAMDRQFPKE